MNRQLRSMRIGICLWVSLFAFYSCSPSSAENNAKPDPAITKPKHDIHTVEIRQMQFVPAILKVKKGDEVVFVNRDMVAHDVTEAVEKKWSSSALQNGEYWTLAVIETSDYYCSIHPVMKGQVIME